jgi:type I restriction enzyme S subunit
MPYKETNFKETQIGKIPEDWDMAEVGDLGEVITGTTPSTFVKEYWNGEYPFVTPTDMTEGKYVKETERKVTEKGLQKGRLIPKDSVLVTCIASVGKIALASEPCITNQQINAIICKEGVDPHYVYYATAFRSNMLKNWAGRTTNPIVKKSLFEKFPLALPRNVNEQQKIAEVLSTLDEAIQKTSEVIAKTERLKKGLMQELLTKGIGHKDFKDTEIGRIPKEWMVVKLGEIIEIHDSKRIPLSEMERSKRKGNYPYCGANGIIDYIDDYIFDGEYVLLAEDGGDYSTFGKSAYLMSGKFWVNNHAHVLSAIQGRTINLFVLHILNFFDLNPYIVGSTRKKLNQEQMKEIKLPLPSLGEQQKIAEILSTIDQKLEVEGNEKARLERIKQGSMDLLLTGKIRVKVN